MHLSLHAARSGEQLDQVFRLRYEVLVRHGRLLPTDDSGRVIDRFDAYPETANLVAEIENRTVGALRVTEESPVGTPLGEIDALSRDLSGAIGKVATASMLCLSPIHRSNRGLAPSLLNLATTWAHSRGATHVIAGLPVALVPVVVGFGWSAVGDPRRDANGLEVVPVACEIRSVRDGFLDGADANHATPFRDTFNREVYNAGDVIIRHDTAGDGAYVLLRGSVGIYRNYESTGQHGIRLAGIGPGEVFGEIALLAESQRTATVVAESDVDLMVLTREEFEAQVMTDSSRAMSLCRLLARRLAAQTDLVGAGSLLS